MVVGTNFLLTLNTTAAEADAEPGVYTTTTGFEIQSTGGGINASGGTYLYLAIA